MTLLVRTLRFIVGFLSYLIIVAAVILGLVAINEGQFVFGVSLAVGGLIGSAVLFGMIALQFEISDHLAAIRKYIEGVDSGPMTPEKADRMEPRFGRETPPK